jgi:N-acetylneuraminic acid mutarotase
MSLHSAAVGGLAGLVGPRARLMLAALALLGACDGGQENKDSSTGPSGSAQNPKDMRWQALAPVPVPRYYVGVGAAHEKVFVIGGFRPAEATLVHVYDTKTNTWAAAKALPSGYSLPNVASVNDRLFVLGGFENPRTLEYDFSKDDWIARAPLPTERGRGGAAVGVTGTTVLLAGGIIMGNSANNLATGIRFADLFAYDVTADSWSTLTELPVETGYAVGAVLGNVFWVVGGSTNFSRTEQVLAYDLTNKVWMAAVHPLPVSISSAAVGILGGTMVVTGGIASGTGMISKNTFALDQSTGDWATIATLPTPRFGMGGAVVGNRLYVPTGLGPGMGDAPAPSAAFEALGM